MNKSRPLLLLVLPILVSCGESETTLESEALPLSTPEFIVAGYMNDPAALRRGQDLFLGSCVSFCHNLIEEEPDQADALFLFDCQWTHAQDNAEIFRIIKEGVPDTRMVGFGENFPEGDNDVWKIIAYIRQSQDNCGDVSR
ncbi:MAG: c-type cytochrome [Gammaproteobacteria bacterium]|nr:c-type cytochrome [Gammaproteobacteria bacterium]